MLEYSNIILIENLFPYFFLSLKNDIKRGGLSGKYKELELVEVTQNIEYIRIAFDKKYKEFDKLKASIEPSKIIDLRYREIKQREYEALENYNRVDKILQECEEKERKLEEICKEYEDIKTETLVLNNRTTRYDYGNTLYKKNNDCLKRINTLEREIIVHRQLYELSLAEDTKKKDEVNKDMEEFFSICECFDEEVELEEGILI